MRVTMSLIFVIILFMPCQAIAVQEHAGAEGLVVHELAHLFFLFVSAYLFFSLKETDTRGPHLELRRAFMFFFFWNLLTFTTHIMRERVNPDFFKGAYLQAKNIYHYLWYTGSLVEHLLLVAACLFFLRALLKLKDAQAEHDTEGPEGWI